MRSRSSVGDEPFDGAIFMAGALGIFDDEADHLRMLAALARCLREDARVLLETMNPYFWAHHDRTVHLPPGALATEVDLVRTYRFDPLRGRVEDRLVFVEGGRRELPTQSLRAWTPTEILALIRAAGFRDARVLGTDGWDVPSRPMPLDARHSVWMWVTARL